MCTSDGTSIITTPTPARNAPAHHTQHHIQHHTHLITKFGLKRAGNYLLCTRKAERNLLASTKECFGNQKRMFWQAEKNVLAISISWSGDTSGGEGNIWSARSYLFRASACTAELDSKAT